MWIRILFFPSHVINNTINTAHKVIDKTINADNAIYNYEWFKQKKQDIDAAQQNASNTVEQIDLFINDLPKDKKEWTAQDKSELSRLRTILSGQKNYYNSLVADYNARASMANRSLFENSIVPNVIQAMSFPF